MKRLLRAFFGFITGSTRRDKARVKRFEEFLEWIVMWEERKTEEELIISAERLEFTKKTIREALKGERPGLLKQQ